MAQSAGVVQMPMINWDNPDQKAAFSEWKDFITSYFVINGVKDEVKWHYVLLSAGKKGHELWNTWGFVEEDKKDIKKVLDKFEQHMVGTVNKWVMRLELASHTQREDESVDCFVCRLKATANSCKFPSDDIKDEQITFQLIKGIRWPEEQKSLIKRGNKLTLQEAVASAQSFEATLQSTSRFAENATPTASIGAMKKSKICKYCGTEHPPRQCPAYGKICNACKKPNHFSSVCRSKHKEDHKGSSNSKQSRNSRNISPVEFDKCQGEYTLVEAFNCGEILVNIDNVNSDERQSIMVRVNAKPADVTTKVTLRLKADTGANGSILPLRCLKQMYPGDKAPTSRLSASKVKLTAVNGTGITQLGTIDMPLQFDSSKWLLCRFYVCETDGPAILSCDATEKLGIIRVTESANVSTVSQSEASDIDTSSVQGLKKAYPECFKGIGKFPNKYKIELKPDAVPVVSHPRKYPIQLKQEICDKLHEMEKLGVLEKCNDDRAYDWVSSLAFSRKASGELRICLDPRNLNLNVRRTYHKMPTIDEISYKFSGSTVFSKLDAKHGYWSIVLEDESSDLCAFNSPAGKYKFKRLPFGLKVSQDIFQKYMDEITEKAGDGVTGIADDIVVHGKDLAAHNDALLRLMKVAKQYGLVFREEKCDIKKESISFYGLMWSSAGVSPDKRKCDDIKSRPTPKNKQELHSFLGMIQYSSPFMPQLSQKTSPLRNLLKADAEWEWCSEHEAAFQALKDAIHEDLLLRFFNPKEPSTIEVDASMLGLGAALVQNGKPVAFASKALTTAETNYANIERELLAVVFGLEKFHTYIYGSTVTVYTDHKPLENIKLKELTQAPPRLQRMLLRIQPYDINLTYKRGKEMVYADYLSRIHPSTGPAIELEKAIHMIQISAGQMDRVKAASENDPVLSALCQQVIKGWPRSVSEVPKILRCYWSMRDYLTVEDGVVYTGSRLVIPETMQEEYLQRIHAGHQGITKSQLRAKESIYWPKMLSDIEAVVKDCNVCLEYARSLQKEPLMPHDTPSQPWEVISSDLFELHGNTFILMVDHFSKMPFVRCLKSISSAEVIKFHKDMFAIHGIPKLLYSDNGPQYDSTMFRDFAKTWDFEHTTSSPRYPQSNGFIERNVQTIKLVLKKAIQSGTDLQIALLCLRSTPLDHKTPSPAELLYGRKIRSNLPAKNGATQSIIDHHEWLESNRQKQTEQYNKDAGPELPELFPGMNVMVQEPDKSRWIPGTIQDKCPEPRSYTVKMPNGSILRRNRRYLKELSPNASQKMTASKPQMERNTDDYNIPAHDQESPQQQSYIQEQHADSQPAVQPSMQHPTPQTVRRSQRVSQKPQRLGIDE